MFAGGSEYRSISRNGFIEITHRFHLSALQDTSSLFPLISHSCPFDKGLLLLIVTEQAGGKTGPFSADSYFLSGCPLCYRRLPFVRARTRNPLRIKCPATASFVCLWASNQTKNEHYATIFVTEKKRSQPMRASDEKLRTRTEARGITEQVQVTRIRKAAEGHHFLERENHPPWLRRKSHVAFQGG